MRKSLAGVWTLAALVAACSGFGSEDEETPTPTPIDNSQPPPPPVDGKPTPGIYVSASKGRGGNTGFPGSPLPSLKEGFARAKQENLRLIVCAEDYAENVELIDGVSAYGYYDCNVEPWTPVQKRATVRAPVSPAMVAREIKLPTRIEGFEVYGPDLEGTIASDREGTSVALHVRSAAPKTLVFSGSKFRGGNGGVGSDGAPAAPPTPNGTSKGTDGIEQSSSNCQPTMLICANNPVPGVAGPAPTCEGGEPAPGPGGNGGDGMWFIDCQAHPQANNIQQGRPLTATAATAVGGQPCNSGPPEIECGRGAAGAAGQEGQNGANGVWRFDYENFVPGSGVRGKSGAPGQGGGGGGGAMGWYLGAGFYTEPTPCGGTKYYRSARGSSGGAGGCGGLAGTGGGGGGASIGALLIDAAVTLETVSIESSNGGRAGSGTLGSLGKSGGAGGDPLGYGGGRGGDGGRGGNGGSSGHGAAGPSIALVWRGPGIPVKASTDLRPGSGGEGRASLSQPLGPPSQTIPAAAVGASIAEYEIKQ